MTRESRGETATVREKLRPKGAAPKLLTRVQRREITIVDVATQTPSPYARSLLFGYVAQFVYEGDSPIAERRAAALSLDQGLLAELLGRAELRELLDPEVLAADVPARTAFRGEVMGTPMSCWLFD